MFLKIKISKKAKHTPPRFSSYGQILKQKIVKIIYKGNMNQSLLASLVKFTSDLNNSSAMQCYPSAIYGITRLISSKIKNPFTEDDV